MSLFVSAHYIVAGQKAQSQEPKVPPFSEKSCYSDVDVDVDVDDHTQLYSLRCQVLNYEIIPRKWYLWRNDDGYFPSSCIHLGPSDSPIVTVK